MDVKLEPVKQEPAARPETSKSPLRQVTSATPPKQAVDLAARRERMRTAGVVLLSLVGPTALGAGSILTITGISNAQAIDLVHQANPSSSLDSLTGANAFTGVGGSLMVIGAAGLVVGGVLLAKSRTPKQVGPRHNSAPGK